MQNSDHSLRLCTQHKISVIPDNASAPPPDTNIINGHQNIVLNHDCCQSFSLLKIKSYCGKSHDRCMEDLFRRFLCFFLVVIFIGLIIICSCFLYDKVEGGSLQGANKGNLFWSSWSPWSECDSSSKISSRNRTCTDRLLIPQVGCVGLQSEFMKCDSKNHTVTGTDHVWTEWSEWSSCSDKCKDSNKIPYRSRKRTCKDSISNKNVDSCIGERNEYEFCKWLKSCPKSSWSEWIKIESCTAKIPKKCGPGFQTLQRKCLTKESCVGHDLQIDYCWSHIGCPVNLQPPKNVELVGDGKGNFKINWIIVPYGEIPSRVGIFLTMKNVKGGEIKTLNREVVVNYNAIKEQIHGINVNLSQYLSDENFTMLTVRLFTLTINGKFSVYTDPISSGSRAVDGQWGEWGDWSYCSEQCGNKRGTRIRTRVCDSPDPSNGGKECQGISEESTECIGTFKDNCEETSL